MSKQRLLPDCFSWQKETATLTQASLHNEKPASADEIEKPKGSVSVPSDHRSSPINPSQAGTWHGKLAFTPKSKSTSKKRSRQESIQDDPIPFPTSIGGTAHVGLPNPTPAVPYSPTGSAHFLPQQSSSFLNSLPPGSSQTPLFSSSQRIEKNGKIVVTSSDGDTSDSESLLDPDELLAFGKQRKSTPPTEPEAPLVGSPNSPRRSARLYKFADESPTKHATTDTTSTHHKEKESPRDKKGRFVLTTKSKRPSPQIRTKSGRNTRDGSVSPTLPRQRNYKFDLKSLVRHNEAETTSKKHQSEILEALKAYNGKSRLTPSNPRVILDGREEALIAQVVQGQGDEDNIDRLLLALQRTESLERDKKWSFFKSDSSPALLRRNAPQLNDPIWGPLTKDQFTRDQTFLSGFAQDVASDYGIPDELMDWLIDALVFEAREDLRTAYLELLATVSLQVSLFLTIERIHELLRKLGAKDDALDLQEETKPISRAQDEQQKPSGQLTSVLALIAYTAQHLGPESLQTCLHLACRLVIDDAVSHDAVNQQAVDCMIAHLLEGVSDDDAFEKQTFTLCEKLFTSLPDISLRALLVSRLPALTTRTSLLRIRLAIIFLFSHPAATSPPLALNHISSVLARPSFTITRETDYTCLASYVIFLNITLSSISLPPPTAPAETRKAHDSRVDEVAAKVKSIFSSIVDTGASHMKRTQVKQELESLHSRILYSMRTKRKKRELMLGDDGEEEIGGSVMRQGKLMFAGGKAAAAGTEREHSGAKEKVVSFG